MHESPSRNLSSDIAIDNNGDEKRRTSELRKKPG